MSETDVLQESSGMPLDVLDEQLRRLGLLNPKQLSGLPVVSLQESPQAQQTASQGAQIPANLPAQAELPVVRLAGTPSASVVPQSAARLKAQLTTPAVSLLGGSPRPDLPAPIEQIKNDPQNLFGTPAVSLSGTGNGTQSTAPQSANAGAMFAASRLNGEGGASAPAVQPRTAEDKFQDLLNKEPKREDFSAEKMPAWKKLLGAVASTAAGIKNPNAAGETARNFFGAPERQAEEKFDQTHDAWGGKVSNFMKAATLRHQDEEDRNLQSEIDARNKPENPQDKKIDEYVNDRGQRVLTFQRANGEVYDRVGGKTEPKQTGHTSAFEAFAYGTPEEKKAAQDYLEFEKKLGARYRTPSEFDERYRLFKEDPDTYKAMFGDKSGAGPDRATATKMLNYFDKRRREIGSDFTLDDQQKAQQLQDVEDLERPFMDAVQPGAADGGKGDRVPVVDPNGQAGTIPRSQLKAAKKKGYREAQPAQ